MAELLRHLSQQGSKILKFHSKNPSDKEAHISLVGQEEEEDRFACASLEAMEADDVTLPPTKSGHGVQFAMETGKEEDEGDGEDAKSQVSQNELSSAISKTHPLLEGLFGAIYVMKPIHPYLMMGSLIVDIVQILSFLYWPDLDWGVSRFQDALFYSHLTGDSSAMFGFWAALAAVLLALLLAVLIQHKQQGATHATRLARLLGLVVGVTTTILCIPLMTAFVKPFECMIRGSDASWFSGSCYSAGHVGHVVGSAVLLLALLPLLVVITAAYYDPTPTLHRNPFTKSSSRIDASLILVKMALVVSFTLFIDWPAIPVLVLGGLSLCLGAAYHHLPPYHLALLNWAHVGFFWALAGASLVQLSMVIDGSNDVVYFAISLGVFVLVLCGSVWWARHTSLPFFEAVRGESLNVRKWHRPWDVEISACFFMPHLYRRVTEETDEDPEDEDLSEEERRYVFDEGCAEHLKAIYTRGIRRYPRSNFLRLRYALFLTTVVKRPESVRAARGHVLRAMKMRHHFDSNYTIFHLRKIWEQGQETTGTGESRMDIISSIEMQRHLKVASQSHHRAKHHIGTFWQLLLDGDADPDALAAVIEKIEKYEISAQSAYAKLIDRFPNSVKVLREYGTFCSEVKNDHDGAHHVFALADQLEEQQSRVGGPKSHRSKTSSEGETDENHDYDQQSLCSADQMSGILSSGIDTPDGTRSLIRSSFIRRSKLQKPHQIRALTIKLWIVFFAILAGMITMAVLSAQNLTIHDENLEQLAVTLHGQLKGGLVAIFTNMLRSVLEAVPMFGGGPPPAFMLGQFLTLLQPHVGNFTECMHKVYPMRFSHYGFKGLEEFWDKNDLRVQVYAGGTQHTEEYLNYWEAVTRLITYANEVSEAAEAQTMLDAVGGMNHYAPFRWIHDNMLSAIPDYATQLPDAILDEEERIMHVHFISMLCLMLGGCTLTILAILFFIRPAVVTIRKGRDSMLSLFQGIPKSVVKKQRDFYKNLEQQNDDPIDHTVGRGKRRFGALFTSVAALGGMCALIIISASVSMYSLRSGCVPTHRLRYVTERGILGDRIVFTAMSVFYDDGVRSMTLAEVISLLETLLARFKVVNDAVKFGSKELGIPVPPSDDRIAEMTYEKLSDTYPMPMDHYLTTLIDSARTVVRETKAAYPEQLGFSQSTGYSGLNTMGPIIQEGSILLQTALVEDVEEADEIIDATITVVMILSIVVMCVLYYMILLQYVVRNLLYESRRTLRMFLLIPEEAVKQSEDLRRFLESNGTEARSRMGKGSSESITLDNSVEEGVFTVDSSGAIILASAGACKLLRYGEEDGHAWPRLHEVMPDVDTSLEVVAQRTRAVPFGGDATHVVYDLHHWGELIVIRFHLCQAAPVSTCLYDGEQVLREELLRLSKKPVMFVDVDGFPCCAQTTVCDLLGYARADDMPNVRSLFPSLEHYENNPDGTMTDVVCKDGTQKRVVLEVHQSKGSHCLVTLEEQVDECVRSV